MLLRQDACGKKMQSAKCKVKIEIIEH